MFKNEVPDHNADRVHQKYFVHKRPKRAHSDRTSCSISRLPRTVPRKPPKDILLTLNPAVQIEYALNSEEKVYTPMDIEEPPVNVDEPRVYPPMDVDETWVTTWNSTGQEEYCHISMDGSQQAANTSGELADSRVETK
ncbi:hypothetical protein B0H14DRAFT_2583305 [Mycena olivaceomarginata]|nr:hypothetical protein B0H14DRAFT_2583305 [Mycena olivaceomarginata]